MPHGAGILEVDLYHGHIANLFETLWTSSQFAFDKSQLLVHLRLDFVYVGPTRQVV